MQRGPTNTVIPCTGTSAGLARNTRTTCRTILPIPVPCAAAHAVRFNTGGAAYSLKTIQLKRGMIGRKEGSASSPLERKALDFKHLP